VKNIFQQGDMFLRNSTATTIYKGAKAFFKGKKPSVLVYFGQFGSGYAFPIRIRIYDIQNNAEPCGSGSRSSILEKLFQVPENH